LNPRPGNNRGRTTGPFRERVKPMQEAVGRLDSIAEFGRRVNMAESTFGRRAVNDGKFVSRLRDGARITPETLERVSVFLTTLGGAAPIAPPELLPVVRVVPAPAMPPQPEPVTQ